MPLWLLQTDALKEPGDNAYGVTRRGRLYVHFLTGGGWFDEELTYEQAVEAGSRCSQVALQQKQPWYAEALVILYGCEKSLAGCTGVAGRKL